MQTVVEGAVSPRGWGGEFTTRCAPDDRLSLSGGMCTVHTQRTWIDGGMTHPHCSVTPVMTRADVAMG